MPLFTNQSLLDPLTVNPPLADPFPDDQPRRIISLVPSLTELLYDLGLDEEVAGITKFCVHPEHWFRTKKRVGGTKNVNAGTVHALRPELVIANKEENLREEVEELALHYAVWLTDIQTVGDALEMIRVMGQVTGTMQKAAAIAQTIEEEFAALEKEITSLLPQFGNPGTAYFIWRKPYMVAGGDTFIHAMMKACGLKNVFGNRDRYPVITIEELQAAQCECLLLSSEPYPFKEKHVEELQKQLPAAKILLVDGEIFSWYGSRMLKAPAYFRWLREKIAGYGNPI